MQAGIGNMSFETFKKILDQCAPYAIKLNWRGEPFMNKEIVKMVWYAKRKGVIDVRINTNGLLLTRGILHSLAWAGLDMLIFSVDGATPETYEKIRVGGDFEKLVKNIMLSYNVFKQYPVAPIVRVQICKQPENSHEIDLWHDIFKNYSDQLRVGHLFNPQGESNIKIEQPRNCPQPWQRMTIAWNGDMFPCPSDFLGKVPLGNISQVSIQDAWHSEAMNRIRNMLTLIGRKGCKPCSTCTSYC